MEEAKEKSMTVFQAKYEKQQEMKTLMETFLAIGIDELSVSPSSVLPLRTQIRKSIAKTCTLDKLEC